MGSHIPPVLFSSTRSEESASSAGLTVGPRCGEKPCLTQVTVTVASVLAFSPRAGSLDEFMYEVETVKVVLIQTHGKSNQSPRENAAGGKALPGVTLLHQQGQVWGHIQGPSGSFSQSMPQPMA